MNLVQTLRNGRIPLIFFMVLLTATVLLVLASVREYMNFGTETDFIGGFVPEAQRVLGAEPLALEFHPPLYAIVLAVTKSLFGDWFTAGLLISTISGVVVAAAAGLLFQMLCGQYAAVFAVLALLASRTNLVFSASATSDQFFFALYWTTLLVASVAVKERRDSLWVLMGMLIALTSLTRSNGFVLAAILASPFLAFGFRMSAIRAMLLGLGGIATVGLIWLLYASVTNSPLWTSSTHVNVALTYFAPDADRITADSRLVVEGQFSSVIDVMTHDPLHIIKTYVYDLWYTLQKLFSTYGLVEFPVYLLAIAGLIFLVFLRPVPLLLCLVALTALHILLLNFKAYEPRYYLFVVPIAGAGIGVMLEAGKAVLGQKHSRSSQFVAMFVACFMLSIFIAVKSAIVKLTSSDKELREAVPAVAMATPSNATVIARKGHIAFYAERSTIFFPDIDELSVLWEFLHEADVDGPLYLYFGSAERRFRPALQSLSDPNKAPEWLEPLAISNDSGAWVLYFFRPSESDSNN